MHTSRITLLLIAFVCCSLPRDAVAQQRVMQPPQFLIDERELTGVVGVRINPSDCLVFIRLHQGTLANGLNESLQTVLLRDGVVSRAEKLIGEFDKICKLTEAQKKKLLGAAKIDANRAARALEKWRRERGLSKQADQPEKRLAGTQVNKLKNSLRSCVYEPTSMLSKMFASTTTGEQQTAIRDNYQEWFVNRIRDFSATSQAKLLKLLQEKHQAGFLGAARETYIGSVMSSVSQSELDSLFDKRDLDQIRRAIGMLVKP